MDDDIIRIVISTDNHLGFMSKDPTRGEDSFAAFEEVLHTAKCRHADFVLLAGDLFHENKPSRKTIHATIDLLRKYCTGDESVYMEVLNDQSEIFKHNRIKKVNYEDPNQAISLPVFAIHGNHDDPSREGFGVALSALDLLSAANLVNYIGKHDQVDDIEITPVLIKKGQSMVALYALGAVRDERLNRMWTQKKVKFLRPAPDQQQGKYLNIFVLHQNRDYGRGRKNCIHESMIPEWMDVVIWGNEHECIPTLVESLVGTFRIYQPGSSVATSLSEGESSRNPKHFGILEVSEVKFRLLPVPYTRIRGFAFEDVCLSSMEGLDPRDPNIEEAMIAVLTGRVKGLIRSARELISPEIEDLDNSSFDYQIRDPRKVLVRLRVDYAGFPTINPQKFGSRFVGEVANPSEVLIFSRRRKENEKNNVGAGNTLRSEFDAHRGAGDAEALSRIRVEDLVCEVLGMQNKQLGLLAPDLLSNALEDFVVKKIPTAITDVVEKELLSTQQYLSSDRDNLRMCTDKDSILANAAKYREKFQREREATRSSSTNAAVSSRPRLGTPGAGAGAGITTEGPMDMSSEDESPIPAKEVKGRGTAKQRRAGTDTKTASKGKSSKSTSAPAKSSRPSRRAASSRNISYRDDYDEEDGDEESDAIEEINSSDSADDDDNDEIGRKPAARGRGARRGKAVPTTKAVTKGRLQRKTRPVAVDLNEESEEDMDDVRPSPTPSSRGRRPATTRLKKKEMVDLSVGDHDSVGMDSTDSWRRNDNRVSDTASPFFTAGRNQEKQMPRSQVSGDLGSQLNSGKRKKPTADLSAW
mmetsp:Transcript_8720/g.13022  ORF Transcript_8720/g.13022 Transcript_8720/m.13022 type:complete len:810 (-) Transcript_8720:149-2578(-)|eukprot:CAMPEP_0185034436 /NCGR_PEP_ID=MMETSP1103-20130426/24326_1 /TAXON_ID=36769 /ORGANISM="Paraphysomonas bandaiensis, Strain Caron Lab Isolate" /LENGTH=809 /DNA_ID=CAMNT_0027571089 /DNA_START=72 /DNA_END=2498 /DNA_ORIENTATION=+